MRAQAGRPILLRWGLSRCYFVPVLVLAFETWGFPPEISAQSGAELRPSPTKIMEKFARKLLDRLPFATILIHDSARITHCNGSADALAPRVEKNGHFTNIFRAPAVLDAIKGTFADGKRRTADFQAAADERYSRPDLPFFPRLSDAIVGAGSSCGIMTELLKTRQTSCAGTLSRTPVHELRTPIASVLGYAEALKSGDRDDPDVRNEFVGIIHKQNLRMQRLIDDFTSLCRFELDEHLQTEESCDVRETIGRVADAMRPIAATKVSSLINRPPDGAKF